MTKTPEILAPVGNWEMGKAAVHNGADAIYVGMPGFNARGRTETLSIEALGEMIRFCHLYGTRVYVAANILIFERELSVIEDILRSIIPLRPDAFIVQDIGLVRLIRQICPEQVIHASTQMTVSNCEAIVLTEDLAIQRYVLARENSIEEIKKIREKTSKELEVFVHGALCVAYSGQCLTSESFGGRSANRGQCAQACRLPYDLIVDGVRRDLFNKRYLVSPQDLFALPDVNRLVEAGVTSFKIEGRLKSPQYVAQTVSAYKGVVTQQKPNLKVAKENLTRIYSRGFFNGWLDGVNHQSLVPAQYSNHHGLRLGIVRAITKGTVEVVLDDPSLELHAGDGVIFEDFLHGSNAGASIYGVKYSGDGSVRLEFSRDLDTSILSEGMTVFVNSSPRLMKDLAQTWSNKERLKSIPITLTVTGSLDSPLEIIAIDDLGNQVQVKSKTDLLKAQKAPLTEESLVKELGALHGTPFRLARLQCEFKGELFIHNRELKELRRTFVLGLEDARKDRPLLNISSPDSTAKWKKLTTKRFTFSKEDSGLNLLVRDFSQLSEIRSLPLNMVYLDYEYGKDYEESVTYVRELGFKVGIATTRILKPGELGHLKQIERLRPDCVLVRNLGALEFFREKGLELRGDFSLNVTNSLSADWFISKGLSSICPSYDLNGEQLTDLIGESNAGAFEVTVHQYMPAFHMEHCVFAAFLSKGKSFRDCGKPCERHRVELRDQKGANHPLKADAECRNTMFNGRAQSALRLLPRLQRAGVRNFRIEALFETSKEIKDKVRIYSSVFNGGEINKEMFLKLDSVERYGITEGQLFNIKTYSDRKKGSETRAP